MISLQNLSQFERQIIEHILAKDAPEYKNHLPYLLVDKRENTVVGCYLYLKYTEIPSRIFLDNRTIGQTVYAEIEGLDGGAGFMLYIDDGKITMLESFGHGSGIWPANISNFEIRNL